MTASCTPSALHFDTFYECARLPAARLGHLLTGSASAGHDVAHDALASMHDRWDDIDDPDAYLRTAIVNRAKNVHRSRFREAAFRRRYRPELVTAIPELDETWRAVGRLTSRQRSVVVLRFYEDLSVAQIAHALELPEGTVKSTLHRAMRQLKELRRR